MLLVYAARLKRPQRRNRTLRTVGFQFALAGVAALVNLGDPVRPDLFEERFSKRKGRPPFQALIRNFPDQLNKKGRKRRECAGS